MTGGLGAALAGLGAALLVWPPRRAVVLARARALGGAAAPASRGGGKPAPAAGVPGLPLQRRLLAAAAGLAAGLLVGGVLGAVVAVATAVGLERWLRRTADGDGPRRRAAALRRELPVACDLLAVCLAAGLPVGGALAAVAEAVPGPVGEALSAVAELYRLGARPGQAWAAVPAELAPLGRALVRAAESGSGVVPALGALAADSRAAERSRTEADLRRAGIWVLAPLGACFLPAFVCLGVAPLVLGIAGNVFG